MPLKLLRHSIMLISVLLVSSNSLAQTAQPVFMWTTYEGDVLAWLTEKADAFNSTQSDYAIQIEAYTTDEVILTASELDLDTEPVILHLQDDSTQRVLDAQTVQPFDNIVADQDRLFDVPVHQADWFDSVTAHATVNDRWMMIPIHSSTAMIYVNLELLTELESSYVFAPEDWTTLELICDELIQSIEDGLIDGCVTWQGTAWLFEQWLAQQNVPLTDASNGRDIRATEFNLVSEGAMGTASFMRNMVDWGYVAYESGATSETAIEVFNMGRVPILFADNTAALSIDISFEANVLISNVDFGWSGARLDTENLWIVSDVESEIAEFALAFSLFLTNPENNIEWHQATGSLPLSSTAYDMLLDSDWAESHPEQINVFTALVDSTADSATLFAIFGQGEEIRQALSVGLDELIFSTDNINNGLQALQDDVLNRLELYNLTNAPDLD